MSAASSATSTGYTVHLPSDVVERLQGRAARADLFDRSGRPDVRALRDRAIQALIEGGDTVSEALDQLTLDAHDPDLAMFTRACIVAAVHAHPPRWPRVLADRLDLDPGTLIRLHHRADREALRPGQSSDLATMASCAVALAFGARHPSEAELTRWMSSHPEPAMRKLFAALERARAAARPN